MENELQSVKTDLSEENKKLAKLARNRSDDYEYAREILYKSSEKIQDILDAAVNLARESEHPRAIEVATEAAKALGVENSKGTLEQGKQADVAVWDINHPNELSYWLGLNQLSNLYIKGQVWKYDQPVWTVFENDSHL